MRKSTGRSRAVIGGAAAFAVALAAGGVIWFSGDRATDAAGAPLETTPATAATLGAMASVLEEHLGGRRSLSPEYFAEALAEARPDLLAAPGWPDADYAVLAVADRAEPSSPRAPDTAVGLVVWPSTGTGTGKGKTKGAGGGGGVGGAADPSEGSGPLCVETVIERAAARLRLEPMRCPEAVPSTRVPAAAEEEATRLAIPSPGRREMTSGSPAQAGRHVMPFRPTEPAASTGTCSAEDLHAAFDVADGAGHTDRFYLRAQNVSERPCDLPRMTGVELGQGEEAFRPPFAQEEQASEVTLRPGESGAAVLEYRPTQRADYSEVAVLVLEDGLVPVASQLTGVPPIDRTEPMASTAWQPLGYGISGGDWGSTDLGFAPPCQASQIGVTTGPRDRGGSSDEPPAELPYWLFNVSSTACRIDPGTLDMLAGVPPVPVPETLMLQSGKVVRLAVRGGAPELHGTLLLDGRHIAVESS